MADRVYGGDHPTNLRVQMAAEFDTEMAVGFVEVASFHDGEHVGTERVAIGPQEMTDALTVLEALLHRISNDTTEGERDD